MSIIFEEARTAASDAARSVLCGVSGANRVSNDIAAKLNPVYRGSALNRFRDRVSDALDSFCPVPSRGSGSTVPFTGGQCEGVEYEVTVEFKSSFTTNPTVELVRGFGPFGAIREVNVGTPSSPDRVQYRIPYFTSSGAPTESLVGSAANPDFVDFVRVTNVTRLDGAPDDCGNPPPELPPGAPPPTDPRPPSTTVTVNLPDVGPIDITLAAVVGIVYADVDASIRVPVTVTVTSPDLVVAPKFDFDINLSDPSEPPKPIEPAPEVDDDGRPEEPDCPLPPECGEEPEEEDPDEPDQEKKDEEGRVITGGLVLSVRSSGPIRQTERLMGSTPELYIPYLALGTFVYERPDGGLCYSADIPIKRTVQVVPAPKTGLKILAFRCQWESGWTGETFNVVATDCCNSN